MSQRPDDQKNLIIAVVLSMAVMLGWQFFYAGPQMKAQQERAQRRSSRRQKAAEAGRTAPQAPAVPGAPPATTAPTRRPRSRRPQRATRRLDVGARIRSTRRLCRGSISLKGGLIDDVVLKNYRETVDPKSPNVVLFSPPGSPVGLLRRVRLAARSEVAAERSPTARRCGLVGGQTLTPATPVTLTRDNGRGLLFKRTLSIDDKYMHRCRRCGREQDLRRRRALRPMRGSTGSASRTPPDMPSSHEGLIGVPGDASLQEITYAHAVEDGGGKTFDGKTGGWLGITDKYWAASLVPDQNTLYSASFRGRNPGAGQQEFYWVDYQLPAVVDAGAGRRRRSSAPLCRRQAG